MTAYLNYLFDEGLRRDNPGLKVKRFKDIMEGKTQAVTKDELNSVSKRIDLSIPTNVFHYAIVLAFFTMSLLKKECFVVIPLKN